MYSAINFNCQHRYPCGFQLNAIFEADRGVTALCGPSGSGKTTIVSLLAGLLQPDKGYITIGNQIVTDTEAGILVRPEQRRVGLLFQDYCLFPHLRVHANISYGMVRRGGTDIQIDRVIKTLELDGLLQRYPRTLSGGQKQRVALARAIVSSPRLLLLDEPLTAVEVALRDRIAALIARVLAEFEIPTLLVSHNRELIDRLARRVLLIEQGEIRDTVQLDAEPSTKTDFPAFRS